MFKLKFVSACCFLLWFAGCASPKPALPVAALPAPPVETKPADGDACIPRDKVVLVNNVLDGEFPVLMSVDHKKWKTVLLKNGIKNQFGTSVPRKKDASQERHLFVHTGKEQSLAGGNYYSVVIEKGVIAVNRVPTKCTADTSNR